MSVDQMTAEMLENSIRKALKDQDVTHMEFICLLLKSFGILMESFKKTGITNEDFTKLVDGIHAGAYKNIMNTMAYTHDIQENLLHEVKAKS